jgi:hypothetical protein
MVELKNNKEVEAFNGYIEITSICDNNCEIAWSRINTVEI